MPTDYEVVTSQLHYYPKTGFAVDTPVTEWYQAHQPTPPVDETKCDFADPRSTTYSDYVRRKHEQEIHLDRSCAERGLLSTLSGLPPPALSFWDSIVAPARFPLHGLQMLAAYSASMAPLGRLTVVLAFQAADELQRIHRIGSRLSQLRASHPTLAPDSRGTWEQAAAWQGIRKCIERLLVTYDWIDGYIALNVVFKPLWELVLFEHCAERAQRLDDLALAAILDCYAEDGRWHRECTAAACQAMEAAYPDLPVRRDRVIAHWLAFVQPAFETLARAVDVIAPGTDSALEKVRGACARAPNGPAEFLSIA